jgi:2-(1,2-epoxy-1,2-dihydrophenyl)acetyl-CoA isomerase
MGRVLRVLSEDSTVRACVITGAPPAFCAGGDIGTLPMGGESQPAHYQPARAERYPAVAIRDCPFPVLAAVNGAAAGAGFALALACDLAVADPAARFGALQVRRGLVADWALTWLLVRAVGRNRALELLWGGDWVEATDAAGAGLVNRVSSPGAVLEETMRWAAELAQGPSSAMTLMKRTAHRALEMSLEEALETDSLMQARTFATADAAEGARAFREKRTPQFRGH